MRLIIHEHPGPFERFHLNAFQDQVGETIPLILDEGTTHAQIVAAEVRPCGGVSITLEVAPWN